MSDVYRFGQFVLDPRKRTLSRASSAVPLTPKAFDLLLFLAQNPNRLVTKEELLRAVWGDIFVEEGNLTQYISHLRKALGDNAEDTRLIVTIARKGYQFTANVNAAEVSENAKPGEVHAPTSAGLPPDVRPVGKLPIKGTVRRNAWRWWKPVLAFSFAVVSAGAGYMSWLHFRTTRSLRPQKIMLAVLPFENLTGDPNKEYLADGLTEETISQLGRLDPKELGVIARTSVMGYKHKDERLDEIGRDLSVQYVLENSIRQSGNDIRLTAQLIQVKDQTHLWSGDYDYSTKDILSLEDDVAKAVAREIQIRLTSQKQLEPAQSHTVNPQAFDAYLQGYYSFQRNTPKDDEMAAKYYQRATELDPEYALAWVGLSHVRDWQVNTGAIPAKEGHRLAREAAERALALNPNLAEAHAQMGRIKEFVDFDWAGADESIQRAIALDPGNAEGLRTAATSAVVFGRFDQALELARRAVELDPLNAASRLKLGWVEYQMGDLDEAVADLKRALELNPHAPIHRILSEIYVLQGRPQDAPPEIDRVRPDYARACMYAIAYHALGKEKESDAALSELIEKYSALASFQIAQVYAFRKQPDEAFEWLNRSYAQHDEGLILTKVDPLLRNLHGDPRYAAFLKKLNLPA